MRKSVQNSLLTAFFTGKMKINQLGTWNIPFSWQTVDIFRPFSSPWEECFDWKHVTYMCFQENPKNLLFLRKMQEISALEANIDSFQHISVKYLPFPHPDISLMIKDLTQIKVYTYFNIGDVQTLQSILPELFHIPIFQQIIGIFLSRLF